MTALVSIIAPCRNERAMVDAFCDAVLAQRLPQGVQLEVLIADGESDDGTRDLLTKRCAADPRFVRVDNPGRIVSAGLNAALARARGEIIVRMDLHTVYADDYVASCLATLQRTGADNVGGPWVAEGDGRWQRAIAAASRSRWVAGGALSRQRDYEGPADTVYLGCWPRATFDRHGGFDEDLVRNQDDEHNLRMTLAGAKIWQSASIRSIYRPRARLPDLFRQWLQYGYWKPFVMRKHGQPAALRHLVPGAFVAALALTMLAALFGLSWIGAGGLLLLYAIALLALSLRVAHESSFSLLPRLPAVIAAQQIGYGIGSLAGWWDALRHGKGRARFARLTR